MGKELGEQLSFRTVLETEQRPGRLASSLCPWCDAGRGLHFVSAAYILGEEAGDEDKTLLEH